MRKLMGCILLLALLLPSLPASGASVSATSRSYFTARESGDSNRHFTFYEYLDAEIAEIGRGFSFHAGGWGRFDLGEESYGESSDGELQYGYLNYLDARSGTSVRLGRFFVSEGVTAAENIDGLFLGADLLGGISFAGYGGVPIETDDDGREGDFIYGGRLSQGVPGLYTIGISYLKEENDRDDFREEAGVDIFFSPAAVVALSGLSAYNGLNSDWMEHDYRLSLGPFQRLTLRGEASWIDYGSFFQATENSAFDQASIDPEEVLLILGGEAEYDFGSGLSAAAGYRNYDYDLAGGADSFGGRLAWSGSSAAAGLSYRRMDGESDPFRYHELRGYVTVLVMGADVTLDLLDVRYDEEINGINDAYSISLAVGYTVSDRIRFAVDGEYSSNPFYDEDVRGFLKFIYRLATAPGDGGGDQ